MAGFPWIQFYPRDWTAGTRMLTLAAKGAWIDILAALHDSPTRGSMTLTVEAWARVLSISPDEAGRVLAEIKNTGVGNVVMGGNGSVMVECRRMLREEHAREKNRQRVQRHRNKDEAQSDETAEFKLSNGDSNGCETVMKRGRSQKLEARSQNKTVGRNQSAPDDEWIASLKTDPAFGGIDTDREVAKCRRWCETNRKSFSTRRIINWLNRAEPVAGVGSTTPISQEPDNLRFR